MVRPIQNFSGSWVLITILAYISIGALQFYAVFPAEAKLLPRLSQYASLIFLPHAVRVLATILLGPKSFIALFLAVFISQHIFFIDSYNDMRLADFIYPLIGAACAPVAYLIVQWASKFSEDHTAALLNWRRVLAIGIVASAINSIGLAIFLFDLQGVGLIVGVILRFFVGDIMGLMVGLIVLTYVFRLWRITNGG